MTVLRLLKGSEQWYQVEVYNSDCHLIAVHVTCFYRTYCPFCLIIVAWSMEVAGTESVVVALLKAVLVKGMV